MNADQKPALKKDDEVKWGPIAAIFGSFAILIIATILVVIAFPEIASSDASFAYKFVAETVYVGLIVATTIAMAKVAGSSFKALGIKPFKKPKADIIEVIKIFFMYLGASLILFYLLSFFLPENVLDADQDLGFGENLPVSQLILVGLSLIVFVPIAEEVLFRGYLFKGLRSKLDFWVAATISSLLFGLAHMQLNVGIDVAIMGIGACWLLEKSGSIYASILLHSIKNSIAFLLVFVVEL